MKKELLIGFMAAGMAFSLAALPCGAPNAAAAGDEEKPRHEVLYEEYKDAPEGSDEKDRLYKEYMKEYSRSKRKNAQENEKSEDEKIAADDEKTAGTEKSDRNRQTGERGRERNGLQKKPRPGDDAVSDADTGSGTADAASGNSSDAYEKYKNAPEGPEKDRLYKEYLKKYNAERSGSKAAEAEDDEAAATEGADAKKSPEKPSKKPKVYQHGSPKDNARARADEAYERYRNAPDGSAEKKEAYAEYQKAYREYLAEYSDSKKLETGLDADDEKPRAPKAGEKNQTGGKDPRSYPQQSAAHAAAFPGQVSYLADTPSTPVPAVSGGGGGGNVFKKMFRKLEQSTEMIVGAQTSAALELLYGVNKDAELNARLDRVATRIAAVSDRKDLKYKFKVLNMKEVNAFAVPGGAIYVTKDLMDFITSDSELAAILGHEMGHQVGKHSIKAIERALLVDYFIRTSKIGAVKNNKQALEIANVFLSLKYSRDNEFESDRYGFKYATMAGYNPYGMVKFFEKLKNKYEKEKTPAFLRLIQTHPSTHDRLIESQNMAQSFTATNPAWREGYSMLPR